MRILTFLIVFLQVSAVHSQTATKTPKTVSTVTKSLIGKWASGSLETGRKSLVLGEGGVGTYTFACDVSLGEGGLCRCKYSSKINCTWKVNRDTLIVKFAETSKEDGEAMPSGNAQAIEQKTCKEMSCNIIMASTYGQINKIKGFTAVGAFILAGSILDWADIEFKRE